MSNAEVLKSFLGIEFGSTRIKAAAIDEKHSTVSAGDFTWKSSFADGVWTYPMDEVWAGLKAAIAGVENRESIAAAGVSAMMHGYLPFDKDWNLLVPFRTWQNTMTGEAAAELSSLFGFNIPQRWSIAHLYQAVRSKEPHVNKIAHITTLAGYVHYMLTGVNAVGIGEGSGIFPVDSEKLCYDGEMLEKFQYLLSGRGLPWKIRDLLPALRLAGEPCGTLTEEGAKRLGGLLRPGTPFCPPEGDAETGMTATNAVAPRTGNVSAGTSIFSMVVLERPLKKVYPEIGIVTTPTGRPVAMVHCANCTGDMNAWLGLFRETLALFGAEPDRDEFFSRLYRLSLQGAADCGGVMVCNYLSGESVTHTNEGRPMVLRKPGADFSLANFLRAQLYSAVATLSIGMRLLREEGVRIDSLTGHGGLFKTPLVGQRYLASACGVPVTCMKTAGEGGPYGMALLAAYMVRKERGESLEDYLDKKVFAGVESTVTVPEIECARGVKEYVKNFEACLRVEREAIKAF